jgi:hypothetical protein
MEAFGSARRRVRGGLDWCTVLGRVGLVAKGASYGLVGLLAIAVAAGVGGAATSRQGALAALAAKPFGGVVLVLLAAGFASYAGWRLTQIPDTADDEPAKAWAKRAGYIGRALVYFGLTFSTIKILTGAHEQSQEQKAQKTTSTVLDWPAGRWLVVVAGLVLIGVGVWNAYRGLARRFDDKWKGGPDWGVAAGVAGHLARFVVFSLIGVFAIRAAIQYDPQEAVGLDGALRKLADASYGPLLLGVTAAGLLAYALYCFVDARYRDVSG